jgi:hypothetical protein
MHVSSELLSFARTYGPLRPDQAPVGLACCHAVLLGMVAVE